MSAGSSDQRDPTARVKQRDTQGGSTVAQRAGAGAASKRGKVEPDSAGQRVGEPMRSALAALAPADTTSKMLQRSTTPPGSPLRGRAARAKSSEGGGSSRGREGERRASLVLSRPSEWREEAVEANDNMSSSGMVLAPRECAAATKTAPAPGSEGIRSGRSASPIARRTTFPPTGVRSDSLADEPLQHHEPSPHLKRASLDGGVPAATAAQVIQPPPAPRHLSPAPVAASQHVPASPSGSAFRAASASAPRQGGVAQNRPVLFPMGVSPPSKHKPDRLEEYVLSGQAQGAPPQGDRQRAGLEMTQVRRD